MSLPLRLPRPALSSSAPSGTQSGRLHPYVSLARRYWVYVLGATLLGALVAYGLSQLVTPSYNGRSTLYFSIGYGDSGTDLNQGATYTQGQMLSFAELARSERVLEPVINDLDLAMTADQLADQIEVTTPANTVVLNITASSGDAELAATIANRVAQSLTIAVLDVAPRDADGKVTVSARTVESATPSTVASSPNTRVNVIAGALLGLALSLLVIAAVRLLDTRLRDSRGVEAAGGLPVLARLRSSVEGAFSSDPDGDAAEDYRRLVTTLDAVDSTGQPAVRPARTTSARRARVFVLTSMSSGSGRAHSGGRLDDAAPRTGTETPSAAVAVAANLALAAAEAGHKVAVVSGSAGSPAAVSSDDESAVTTRALPKGGTLPASLLSSHDLVLIAAPGTADGSRALRLAQAADGVVLLADEGHVHIGELRDAIELFHTAGANVAGTVLTSSAHRRRTQAEQSPAERQGGRRTADSPRAGARLLSRVVAQRPASGGQEQQ